jgi:thioredoxin reductase (NADPH)
MSLENKIYDLIIVGSGPAGLTAAIFASRYKMDCVVLGNNVGGTANVAHEVENWPGFKGHGWDLMKTFKEHVESFEVPLIAENVKDVKMSDALFTVKTEKRTLSGRTMLLAMGTNRRKLDIPGETKFFGKGVSYCATCDCTFFKDKVVGVVGGSDAAAMAAIILAEHAKEVTVIYRKDKMRAETARVERLENNPKVKFKFNTKVVEAAGTNFLEKVLLDSGEELALDGLFIEIGGVPITSLASSLGIKLEDSGRIMVNDAMETNLPGVFAAGDISTGSDKYNLIVTAASEGSIAACNAFKYLGQNKLNK